MKKCVVLVLLLCLCVGVDATSKEPKYKIIAKSNSEEDIEYMYQLKTQLLKDYKEWSKGVDNKDQVLSDYAYVYNAVYKQGVFLIDLGDGKAIEGDLKVNYCESTQEIEKKSLLFDWLF